MRRLLLRLAEEYRPPENAWVVNCRASVKAWEDVVARSAGPNRERAERVLARARRSLAEALADPPDPNDRRPMQGGERINPG